MAHTSRSAASARSAFRSCLLKSIHAPGPLDVPKLPEETAVIPYRSGPYTLTGYLDGAGDTSDARCPAILYSHGGCGLSDEHFASAERFVDAGFVVFSPTYRGEHHNPGYYELFLGEVDDARAALTRLAAFPQVDASRIYAFGYSMGGEIAALLSLFDDLPLRCTGSCGPFFLRSEPFSEESMYGAPVPFDVSDERETHFRLLRSHLGGLALPHTAFVGREDEKFLDGTWRYVRTDGTLLSIIEVDGTHDSSLAHAIDAFLEIIHSDR